MNNQFGDDFDKYVRSVFEKALEYDICAIGITDYFCIEGYKKIKSEYLNPNKLSNLNFSNDQIEKILSILILPNIEFRLNKFVENNRINFHIILSNEISIQDIEESFLHELDFVYQGHPQDTEEKRKLKKDNLIELGEKLQNEHEEFRNEDILFTGMKNVTVDDGQIMKILNNNRNFKSKYLIFVPSDEDLSKINWNGQDHLARKAIIQKSDGFLTANKKTINWALGKNHDSPDKFIQEFKTLKPSICTSDSHSYESLFIRNDQQFCWIKADPTFEGLRQVIYEPEDRVKIQANKPDEKSNYFVIDKLKFTDSANSIFGQQEIYLNPNLNSIIGGKSSGKSLLLNAIAKSIDPEQVKKNFENLRLEPYEDIDFEITWKDGINNNLKNPNMDDFNLEKSENNSNRRRVTYLPQLYLNHLAEKDSKDELNELIEKILVQDESFKDFMDNKKLQISDITHEISDNVKKFIDCYQQGLKIKQEKEELGDQDAVKKEIEKLENKKKRLEESSKLSPEQRKTWSQLEAKKKKINATITSLCTKIELVEEIKRRINKVVIDLCSDQNSHGELIELLNQYPNDYDDLKEKVSSFQENLKSLVDRSFQEFLNTTEINKSIEAQKNSLKEIDDKIKPFLRRIDNEKNLQTIIKKYDNEYSKKVKIEEFEKKQKIMRENYKQIKEKIRKGLISRKAIYDEIINKINSTIGSVDEAISLQAQALIDKETFPLFAQINKSKVSNLDWYKNIFNEEKYIEFDKILNLFKIILLQGDRKAYARVAENQIEEILLKNNFSFESIYEGFAKDTFMLDYDLEYKGDKILKMSPGKKGTVLLILFLKTNTSQYPILIDQPEDNLDNRTIYEEISKFIKNKKKERQIILVSHNPNLVVSTDSENVIVANQSGQEAAKDNEKYKFEYINGAIENSYRDDSQKGILYQQGIKEHICDILEGGKEAFKKRENKYNF